MDKKTLHTICEKILNDFYNRKKSDDRILSIDKILSFFSFFSFKINPYTLIIDSEKKIIKEKSSEIIFGLKSGIVFTKNEILIINWSSKLIHKINYKEIDFLEIKETPKEDGKIYLWDIKQLNYKNKELVIGNKLFQYEEDLINEIKILIGFEVEKHIKSVENESIKIEEKRLSKLETSQKNIMMELDKDGNGEVDVVEGDDFNKLLKKHQKRIVDIDRNYVQQFVKVSSYLKTKKGNIQSIFNSIKNTPNQEVLNEYVEILKGDIHSYNLILFNSLNMIVSLVEDEMITFYEIHEQFDTLNMFDSKHEKDISQKLSNIGDGLENLIYEIRDMSDSINNSIGELSYITEDSNRQLTEQLSNIDSSLGVNNLLTGIQTFQMYKINKNTKSLNG
tara:strand:+ start:800 stop:1975 length:1176 start_codon:yes stop_codon:yes gene_type:complete